MNRGLVELDPLTEYRSLKEDPLEGFYKPCLQRSIAYKRAVGYFTSSIYVVTGREVIDFSLRGGRIQLICSPHLSMEDFDSISLGYVQRAELVNRRLMEELSELMQGAGSHWTAQVLATLVAVGSLDIRIALGRKNQGLYHEKIGVFEDSLGNKVSFKGSANETWSAWAPEGNFESIEVFCSWREGLEEQRVLRHNAHFESIWSGSDPDVATLKISDVTRNAFLERSMGSLNALADAYPGKASSGRVPLPHQVRALQVWKEQGNKGILEHATGSGKTFTALMAIHSHVESGNPALVLVPSQLLLRQWSREIQGEIPSTPLLLAGGGNNGWRKGLRLKALTVDEPELGGRVILATMQTAASPEFKSKISGGKHLLIVADEVHQMGSSYNSQALGIETGARLGLSATPTRYGDPEGTQKILDYFGPIVDPPFTLSDAIHSGRLVEYEYFPQEVSLDDGESARWKLLSKRINETYWRTKEGASKSASDSDALKLLLIQRARIAKKATAKANVCTSILESTYESGQKWLVYCEDTDQLEEVRTYLNNIGLNPVVYHSTMKGDRDASMTWFKDNGGILLSIKCLDEGVDIPDISHAVILASSQNPRQFIQRRGRVLRTAPGKSKAVIYDAIVAPESLDDDPEQGSLVRSELLRAMEFATHARNRSALMSLRSLAIRLGLDPDHTADDGTEDDTNA